MTECTREIPGTLFYFVMLNLLTVGNTKLLKSKEFGYLSVGLSMLPHRIADSKIDLCGGRSTPECRNHCLNISGRQAINSIQASRKTKTLLYLKNRIEFMKKVDIEIKYYTALAKQEKKGLTARMNMFTDIDHSKIKWDGRSIYEHNPLVQFIEYTKHYKRKSKLTNLHITYSYDQRYHEEAMEVLKRGDNLAVIYTKEIPETLWGYKCINGDLSDLRMLDQKNVCVMLKWKNVTVKGSNNAELKKSIDIRELII